MEITIGKYSLTSAVHSKERFDVRVNVIREKRISQYSKIKTGEIEEDDNVIAWSATLGQALKIIIGSTLADQDEIISCEKYLELYQEKINQINEIANNLLNK